MNNDLEQFSEERLKDMRKHVTAGMTLGHADAMLIRQALDIALAAKQAKPVGYLFVSPDGGIAYSISSAEFEGAKLVGAVYDYPPINSPVIPDGWIAIPKDMLADYRDVKNSEIQTYKASFGSHCDIPRSRWQRDLADLTGELAEIDALLATPQPAHTEQVIPDGWKLVPIEPTYEMKLQVHPIAVGTCQNCGCEVNPDCEDNVLLSWQDMLAAAPKPESE